MNKFFGFLAVVFFVAGFISIIAGAFEIHKGLGMMVVGVVVVAGSIVAMESMGP